MSLGRRLLFRADAMCDGAGWACFAFGHNMLAIGFFVVGIGLFMTGVWTEEE